MQRIPLLTFALLASLAFSGLMFPSTANLKHATVAPAEYPLIADYAFAAYRDGKLDTLQALLTRCPRAATTYFHLEPFAPERTSIVHQALATNDHKLLELVVTILGATHKNNKHITGNAWLKLADIRKAVAENNFQALCAIARFSHINDFHGGAADEEVVELGIMDLALYLAQVVGKHLLKNPHDEILKHASHIFNALYEATHESNFPDRYFYHALCCACQEQDLALIEDLITVSDHQNDPRLSRPANTESTLADDEDSDPDTTPTPWECSINNLKRQPGHATLGALSRAAYLGKQRALEALLKAGYSVDAQQAEGDQQQGYTAQYYACLLNHSKLSATLKAQGAEIIQIPSDQKKKHLAECLKHASEEGLLSVMYACINSGVDAQGEFGTEFTSLAAGNGHLAILEALHSSGAQLTPVLPPSYNTRLASFGGGPSYPFHSAIHGNRRDVATWLLKHRVQPTQDIGMSKQYPQDIALKSKNYTLLNLLLTNTSIVTDNQCTRTPLHFAAAAGNFEIVHTYIASKQKFNQVDITNYTPLDYASQEGHTDIVDALLQAGAHHTPKKARTTECRWPIHHAAHLGHVAIIRRLIKAGADPNHLTVEGETPLTLAAWTGHLNAVEILLAHGARDSAPIVYQFPDYQLSDFYDDDNDTDDAFEVSDYAAPGYTPASVMTATQLVASMNSARRTRDTAPTKPAKSALGAALEAGHIACATDLCRARSDYITKQKYYDGLILECAAHAGNCEAVEDILHHWRKNPFRRELLNQVIKAAKNGHCLKPSKGTLQTIITLVQAGAHLPHRDNSDAIFRSGYDTPALHLIPFGALVCAARSSSELARGLSVLTEFVYRSTVNTSRAQAQNIFMQLSNPILAHILSRDEACIHAGCFLLAHARRGYALFTDSPEFKNAATALILEQLQKVESLSNKINGNAGGWPQKVSQLEIAQAFAPFGLMKSLKKSMIKQTLDKLVLSETSQEQTSIS